MAIITTAGPTSLSVLGAIESVYGRRMNYQSHAGTPAPKLALTRTEAAKAIGQSPATIDRLAKRGLLRPSRGTRRPVYSVAEIERYLRETTLLGDV